MEHAKLWLKNNYLTVLVFLGILVVMMWQIGAYPDILDDYVEFEIHPQVNKVFDHIVAPGEITWDWVEMYQGQGGRSPIYGALIELGLRLFGLTLFGIRIMPALFGFLALLFTYYAMTKFYPKNLVLLFLFLLGTSPWYLSMSRAGGILGFSLSLVLIATSAVALLIKKDFKGFLIPIFAGIIVAIMPYGYLIIRPIYVVLILFVIFYLRRVKLRNLLLFLICLIAITSIQFNNLDEATHLFFKARGESINNAIDQTNFKKSDFNSMKEKLMSNTKRHLNFLLGFNEPDNFWNPRTAIAYWLPDIVLYPRFLVPFFIIGFLIFGIGFLIKPSMYYFTPLLFFGLGLLPGTMSLVGEPNMSRCGLLVFPVYFFIAYSLYQIFKLFYRFLAPAGRPMGKFVNSAITIIIIAGIAGLQFFNYFLSHGSERGDRTHGTLRVYPVIVDYLTTYPERKIVYQEFTTFGEYSAYVHLRLLGGKTIEKNLKSGHLIVVRNENLKKLNARIKKHEIDLVIALNPDELVQQIPVMKEYTYEKQDDICYYDLKL